MLTRSLTCIIRCTMHMSSKLPRNEEDKITLSWLLVTHHSSDVTAALTPKISYFIGLPADRRALVGNSELLCSDVPDPSERGSQLCFIYLGSALSSEAPHLFGSFFLSQAPTLPTFSRHHLRVSSTPQHILHSTPTQSRTQHFPLSAYTEQSCSIMTSSCLE